MGTPLHVLIVEDSEVDALLLTLELRQGGYDPRCERVETASALRAALQEQSWDLVLCDYLVPGFNAPEALALFRREGPDIPFLVVSGLAGEEVAVEVMKAGAHDYILKDRLQRLVPAVDRELREAALRRTHRETERALRESERKFRLLVENAPEPIFIHVEGRFAYLNPAALSLFGAPDQEALLGQPLLDRVPPAFQEIVRERIHRSGVARQAVGRLELVYLRLDGSPVDVEVSGVPYLYGKERGGLAFARDISERKRAEAERSRCHESAERLAQEMAVIAEIGRIIGSNLDIDAVYEGFAAEVRKLIPFDRIVVTLNRPAEGQRYVAYVSGADVPAKRQGALVPLARSINEQLVETRRGLILDMASAADVADRFPSLVDTFQAGIRSLLSVPLISNDEVIGALHYRSRTPGLYGEPELHLAERIGDQIAGAVANARLFAERRQAQASLQESEARLRAIFDQAAVGVAEIDIATGRFLTANRRLCEMLDREEAELRETDFLAVSHPGERAACEARLARLIAGEIPRFTLETRCLRRDGEPVWVNLAVSPLWRPGEQPRRHLIVVQDVSEARNMRDEVERRSRQLAALHQISLDLTAELDLNVLLEAVARRALELIGGTTCNCYLFRPEAALLERVVRAGEGLISRKTTRARGEGLVGVIWETGEPLLVNDYPNWPRRMKRFSAGVPQAMIGAPIRWGDAFLGVLNIMSHEKDRFTATDVETLGMFATQAAIAIRNARLYRQIEQTAVTDELTGLFNRRGFLQLGEREFDRSMRFGRPLAALFIDLDHFKAVNDRFGHETGDRVLRAVAGELRRNTRIIDIAGRYGGEEFVVLLPETLLAGAVQIGERLREAFANLAVPAPLRVGEPPPPPVRLTASLGVAVLTPATRDLSYLIGRADQAQYRAKAEGRNRLCVWETQERPIGEGTAE